MAGVTPSSSASPANGRVNLDENSKEGWKWFHPEDLSFFSFCFFFEFCSVQNPKELSLICRKDDKNLPRSEACLDHRAMEAPARQNGVGRKT